jgi:hypothetical protein
MMLRMPSGRFLPETADMRESRRLDAEIRRLQYEWELDLKQRDLWMGEDA